MTLESKESKLTGRELCHSVALFVFQNRLFKGASSPLLDNLHHAFLIANWPEAQDLGGYTPTELQGEVEPVQWLEDRLHTLGVETSKDLSLLEASDLVSDVEEMTAVPQWVVQPLMDDFPRLWTHHGATYRCVVLPAARKVVLHPENAAAKKAGEPPRGVVPRFRGFGVDFQQASRRVKLR